MRDYFENNHHLLPCYHDTSEPPPRRTGRRASHCPIGARASRRRRAQAGVRAASSAHRHHGRAGEQPPLHRVAGEPPVHAGAAAAATHHVGDGKHGALRFQLLLLLDDAPIHRLVLLDES